MEKDCDICCKKKAVFPWKGQVYCPDCALLISPYTVTDPFAALADGLVKAREEMVQRQVKEIVHREVPYFKPSRVPDTLREMVEGTDPLDELAEWVRSAPKGK